MIDKILFTVVLIFFLGCSSTPNSSNEVKSSRKIDVSKLDIESLPINGQIMLPLLKKNGNEKYVWLFAAEDCIELLDIVNQIGVRPTKVKKRKVVFHAENNKEEISFSWDNKSCPKERRLND